MEAFRSSLHQCQIRPQQQHLPPAAPSFPAEKSSLCVCLWDQLAFHRDTPTEGEASSEQTVAEESEAGFNVSQSTLKTSLLLKSNRPH